MRVGFVLFAVLCTGCMHVSRGPNYSWNVGAVAQPSRTSSGEAGSVGAVGGRVEGAETQGVPTGWGRLELELGGNTSGWAGKADLEAEFGAAAFDPPHHLFGRVGFAGTVERDPYTGLFAIEVPTATVGYQFHGTGTNTYADSMHFEIGAHGGMLAAGRAFSGDRQLDMVTDGEVGGRAIMMGEFLHVRAGYDAIFDDSLAHLVRGALCVGFFFSVCVETRNFFAVFDTAVGPTQLATHTVGITIGAGWSTGLDWSFR